MELFGSAVSQRPSVLIFHQSEQYQKWQNIQFLERVAGDQWGRSLWTLVSPSLAAFPAELSLSSALCNLLPFALCVTLSILNAPQRPIYFEGMISSLWHYWKVLEPLKRWQKEVKSLVGLSLRRLLELWRQLP